VGLIARITRFTDHINFESNGLGVSPPALIVFVSAVQPTALSLFQLYNQQRCFCSNCTINSSL
jgi:hypothetical protein